MLVNIVIIAVSILIMPVCLCAQNSSNITQCLRSHSCLHYTCRSLTI